MARTLAGTKWSYKPPPRNVGMSTTVRFDASVEVTRATTWSSGSPSGMSSFGMRTAGGMSANKSSTLCRPIVRSISSSSEGRRFRLRGARLLRVLNPALLLPRDRSVPVEITNELKFGTGRYDRGRREADRVLVCLGRALPFQFGRDEGEQRAVPHDRHRLAFDFHGNLLEATFASHRGPRNGFLARRNEFKIRPRALLQRRVFGLRDPRFIGGPLLETRTLRDCDAEGLREEDRTLKAASQRASEYLGRMIDRPATR